MENYKIILNNNKIISVSGCHLWSDDSKEYTINRVLFRSATLPEYDKIVKSLNRNHMNSLPFSILLPYQIPHLKNMSKAYDENQVILDASDTGTGKTYSTCALIKLKSEVGKY